MQCSSARIVDTHTHTHTHTVKSYLGGLGRRVNHVKNETFSKIHITSQ